MFIIQTKDVLVVWMPMSQHVHTNRNQRMYKVMVLSIIVWRISYLCFFSITICHWCSYMCSIGCDFNPGVCYPGNEVQSKYISVLATKFKNRAHLFDWRPSQFLCYPIFFIAKFAFSQHLFPFEILANS